MSSSRAGRPVTADAFLALMEAKEGSVQSLDVRTSRTNHRCDIKLSGGEFRNAQYFIPYDNAPASPSSSSAAAAAAPSTAMVSGEDIKVMGSALGGGQLGRFQGLSPRHKSKSNIPASSSLALSSSMVANSPSQIIDPLSSGTPSVRSTFRMLSQLLPRFRTNKTLTGLILSRNKLDDRAACLLADVLRQNTALLRLNLSSNKIGTEGVTRLAQALRTNNRLRMLDISSNSIFNEGCAAVGDMLRVNTGLRVLDMARTESYAVGCEALFGALVRVVSVCMCIGA
jgi:hypothetical protein